MQYPHGRRIIDGWFLYQQVIASNGENLNDYYQNISNHMLSEEAVFLKVEKNRRSANGWILLCSFNSYTAYWFGSNRRTVVPSLTRETTVKPYFSP